MVTGSVIKVLKVFHQWVARSISGMTARLTTSGEWECPPVAEALDTTGIWPIKEYIHRRYLTVAVQVAFRTIYELCTGEDSMTESIRFMRWWDQDIRQ